MQSQFGGSERGPSAFEAILAPLSLQQFLTANLGHAPVHLRGEGGRFRHLLDWDGLASLIETHHLEPPRFRIVKSGMTIPRERYLRRIGGGIDRIDGGALSLLFDTGATAIISHIDDFLPAVAELADEVGDCLGARTAVNLYATWRSDHGFDPHWDSHDVIILQLAGRKQWSMHKPTRLDPLRGDPFEAPPAGEEPECVEILQDGDVLYLPRGWIHAPIPIGEPSMHLTIAITRPTGAGCLAWLARELENDPQVRAAIPFAHNRAALAEWSSRMAAILTRAIEGDAVNRFLNHKDAQRGARPRISFPDFGRTPHTEWSETTMFRPASLHRFMVDVADDGTAQVTAVGCAWPCSTAVAAAIARLTSTDLLSLGSLEADLSEADAAQLRQLLAMLATLGLLATGTD